MEARRSAVWEGLEQGRLATGQAVRQVEDERVGGSPPGPKRIHAGKIDVRGEVAPRALVVEEPHVRKCPGADYLPVGTAATASLSSSCSASASVASSELSSLLFALSISCDRRRRLKRATNGLSDPSLRVAVVRSAAAGCLLRGRHRKSRPEGIEALEEGFRERPVDDRRARSGMVPPPRSRRIRRSSKLATANAEPQWCRMIPWNKSRNVPLHAAATAAVWHG